MCEEVCITMMRCCDDGDAEIIAMTGDVRCWDVHIAI